MITKSTALNLFQMLTAGRKNVIKLLIFRYYQNVLFRRCSKNNFTVEISVRQALDCITYQENLMATVYFIND